MTMMIKDTLGAYREQIRSFLASNFYIRDVEALDEESSLLEGGIIDSTGVLEVVGFIETTFNISVEDSEILPENLDSIQAIACYVAGKKKLIAEL